MTRVSARKVMNIQNEYSRSNTHAYRQKLIQRRRKSRMFTGLFLSLIFVFLSLVVLAAIWLFSVQGRLQANIPQGLRSVLSEATAPKDPFYVLMLGTDGRPGETSFRSDTIVLTRVDPSKKKITLLSIPRDTRIVYKGQTIKINAAHAIDGPEGMVRAVNKLCKVKISHYVEVSFRGFSSLVDSLGGVEVMVPDRIDDWKAGNSIIEKGLQTLNGAEALTFVRSRKFADGDYSRMRHQRIFISALIKKILTLRDPVALVKTVNSTADMVSTDLSVTDIVSMANSMRGIDIKNDLYSAGVPSYTQTIDGSSYVIAKNDELLSLMAHINKGEDPKIYLNKQSEENPE